MRPVRLSISMPVSDDFDAIFSGIHPKNTPVPMDGSSTLPPLKPSFSTASHILLTILGSV